MNLTLWVPPKRASIYTKQYYVTCRTCGERIEPGTIMGVETQDLEHLADDQPPYNAKCLRCSFNVLLEYPGVVGFIHEVVREELKKIIKEEVHDPNGPFSPSGPEQT